MKIEKNVHFLHKTSEENFWCALNFQLCPLRTNPTQLIVSLALSDSRAQKAHFTVNVTCSLDCGVTALIPPQAMSDGENMYPVVWLVMFVAN